MKNNEISEKPNEIESSNQIDDSERKTIKDLYSKDPTLNNEVKYEKNVWYKNKLKLGLIIGGVVLLIVTVIIIAVVASGGKCNSCSCDEKYCEPIQPQEPISEPAQNPDSDSDQDSDPYILHIDHKKGEVSVYDDVISKTSTIVIEKENNDGTVKEREKSSTTTFNGKYLLNVYDVDDTIEPNIYYAYAVLLVLNNITNGKTNYLGGSDIRKSEGDFPFIKFSFDSTGKIDKLYVPENYDKILTAYIYEFIEKIVPKLDKSSYTNKERRLQGQSQLTYERKDNKTFFNKGEKKEFEGFDGSENDRNIKAIVEGNQIKEVKTNSKSSFIPQNSFNVDKKSNFSEENADNTISTRTSPIKGFYETSDSSLTLDSSEENDELTKKISDNIESKDLIEYNNEDNSNSSSENRVLNSKLLSKNQLRNLDDIYLDPWGQPINFVYPLFNVDFLGAKIGLYADISFTPTNGNMILKFTF